MKTGHTASMQGTDHHEPTRPLVDGVDHVYVPMADAGLRRSSPASSTFR